MNNDEMMVRAIGLLDTVGIVKTDRKDPKKTYIIKTFRGQISSFGAAVEMGTLLSAVAFYSSKGGSTTERQKLMEVIYRLITGKDKKTLGDEETLLNYIIQEDRYKSRLLKKQIIDASIAIKLAMNAYELRSDEDGDRNDVEES